VSRGAASSCIHIRYITEKRQQHPFSLWIILFLSSFAAAAVTQRRNANHARSFYHEWLTILKVDNHRYPNSLLIKLAHTFFSAALYGSFFQLIIIRF